LWLHLAVAEGRKKAQAAQANRSSVLKFVPVETLKQYGPRDPCIHYEEALLFCGIVSRVEKFQPLPLFFDYSYPEVFACKSDSIRSLPQPW
jgi:hypothetical protein